MSLKRYKLTIEYDGSGFAGWQPNALTVQEVVEQALSKACGETVRVVASGRTDAGVHALCQVAHADVNERVPLKALYYGTNYFLKKKRVSIQKVEEVDGAFHARFSARSRTYVYKIVNREGPLSVARGYAWGVRDPLDLESMHEAMKMLEGEHDFAAFQSSGCSAKTSVRKILKAEIHCRMPCIDLCFVANAFLYNQVRNMVGALVDVGRQRMSIDSFRYMFFEKKASMRRKKAPSGGLYLLDVRY